jgi:hypothetical protein
MGQPKQIVCAQHYIPTPVIFTHEGDGGFFCFCIVNRLIHEAQRSDGFAPLHLNPKRIASSNVGINCTIRLARPARIFPAERFHNLHDFALTPLPFVPLHLSHYQQPSIEK